MSLTLERKYDIRCNLTGYRRANAQRTDEQDRYQAKEAELGRERPVLHQKEEIRNGQVKAEFQEKKGEESSTLNLEDMSSQQR